jgi:uncharacterized metal-binding protein
MTSEMPSPSTSQNPSIGSNIILVALIVIAVIVAVIIIGVLAVVWKKR